MSRLYALMSGYENALEIRDFDLRWLMRNPDEHRLAFRGRPLSDESLHVDFQAPLDRLVEIEKAAAVIARCEGEEAYLNQKRESAQRFRKLFEENK